MLERSFSTIVKSYLFLQIVNGRPRQGTYALLHSTGPAAESADRSRGSKKSIGGAVKVKMLYGVLLFGRRLDLSVFPTQEDAELGLNTGLRVLF